MTESTRPPSQDLLTGLSRRRVLGVAAGTGALGVVAACGGSSDSDTATATKTTAASSAAPSTPASSSAPATGGAAIAKVADVPVGGGFVDKADKIVVTQPTAGTYEGFTAVCTHLGCTVAKVEKNIISCPCHGSQFSATDGTVKGGPAPKPLAKIAVKVEGDSIVKA